MKFAGAFGVALMMMAIGCGKPDVNEECDAVGQADECADNLVCGPSAGEKPVCMTKCTTLNDCPSNYDCVAVGGTEASATSEMACRSRFK